MIAALFVEPGGSYFDQPNVDPWDAARDARTYAGPWPVVAHPPCARWSRLAGWGAAMGHGAKGSDGGCFSAALATVRRVGGVLEHPALSAAWPAHGLMKPPRSGGWVAAGDGIGWTCWVDQGWYGHRAAKPTWLYAVACVLPSLRWGKHPSAVSVESMWSTARIVTPPEFRAVLIGMAATVNLARGAA